MKATLRFWIASTASPVLCVALLGAGCQALSWPEVKAGIRNKFPQVRQISVDELLRHPSAASSSVAQPLLIDVRTQREFAVSHLPGAIHLDPKTLVPDLGPKVAKDQPLLVYCSVGYRSSRMAQRLTAAGYSDVANLEGSIFEWANRDLPLERQGSVVRQVHPYNRLWGRLLRHELHAYSVGGVSVDE